MQLFRPTWLWFSNQVFIFSHLGTISFVKEVTQFFSISLMFVKYHVAVANLIGGGRLPILSSLTKDIGINKTRITF